MGPRFDHPIPLPYTILGNLTREQAEDFMKFAGECSAAHALRIEESTTYKGKFQIINNSHNIDLSHAWREFRKKYNTI
jgi:hypothetical protein